MKLLHGFFILVLGAGAFAEEQISGTDLGSGEKDCVVPRYDSRDVQEDLAEFSQPIDPSFPEENRNEEDLPKPCPENENSRY